MNAVPVPDAAAALGVAEVTLRRWMREGAPVARRGRRGRGCRALIDPDAVEAWRRRTAGTDFVLAFAGRVPELVAAAVGDAFLQCSGPHKRALAGALAGAWYLVATSICDALREHAPAVPEIAHLPEGIEALRKIARG